MASSKKETKERIKIEEKRMTDKEKIQYLKNYAKVIVQSGANVQQNQTVIISADRMIGDNFVHLIVEECYRSGAKEVQVVWADSKLKMLKTNNENLETLSTYKSYQISKLKWRRKEKPVMIHILSEGPEKLDGIDYNKLNLAQKKSYPVFHRIMKKIEGNYQWTIAAYPSKEWAQKIFPDMKASLAEEKLLRTILEINHIDLDSTKTMNDVWNHRNEIFKLRNNLNALEITEVEITDAFGTALRVKMAPTNEFASAWDKTREGIPYMANLPSEEVFGMPDKKGVDGVVYASKPLSYKGQIIKNFKVKFEKGKVVEITGDNVEELINATKMDDGASHLGEIAFVSNDNSISKFGKLFYETLFDENAACHLAFGRAFHDNVKGRENMSQRVVERKINKSAIHIDFMFGNSTTKIIGRRKVGNPVVIMENGVFTKEIRGEAEI